MSYFDRATEALAPAPLIDELISTIETGNAPEQLRILQRVTDLFMAGSRRYSGPQIELFDAVFQQLSADIEVKARAKLAHRLAGMDNAPPNLIRSFAFSDDVEVAGPVLTHSVQLSDADLVENAATKSQDHLFAIAQRLKLSHLFAIAQRLKLSEAVTDALVERGNSRVVNKVARNRGACLSLAGYGRLTVRARHDRKLMLSLAQRSDIPRQYFLKLLENASASVRAKLEAMNPQAAAAIRGTIDEVATAMQREARDMSREHAVAVRNANHRFNVGPVTEANVHAPAHAQEFEKTVIALAKLGRFPIDLVERALLDEGSEVVLLLAKAAGCSWVTARELLQMYAAGRSLTPDDLARAFERYKKLTQETARSIVRFHELRMKQPSQETAPGAASPALADDAASSPCVAAAGPGPAEVAA
jgi:uncharacterized protein (DUF2336 family)